jgi:hypothetical protein
VKVNFGLGDDMSTQLSIGRHRFVIFHEDMHDWKPLHRTVSNMRTESHEIPSTLRRTCLLIGRILIVMDVESGAYYLDYMSILSLPGSFVFHCG